MQRYFVKGLSALVFALGASTALAQGRPDLVEQSLRNPAREHAAGQMLVQFRRGVADVDKVAALGRINATLVDDVVMTHQRSDGKGDLHLVRLPFGLDVAAAMRGLQNDTLSNSPSRTGSTRHQAISNDTYYTNGSLWGMYGDATAPRTSLRLAGRRGVGRGRRGLRAACTVGIIDEGYMYTHADLAASVWTNPVRDRGQRHRRRRQRLRRRHPRLGLRRQQQHDLRRRQRRPRHARGRHDRRQRRQRRRRGRRLLERQADHRQVPRQPTAARPPTRSRRSTTSPT